MLLEGTQCTHQVVKTILCIIHVTLHLFSEMTVEAVYCLQTFLKYLTCELQSSCIYIYPTPHSLFSLLPNKMFQHYYMICNKGPFIK